MRCYHFIGLRCYHFIGGGVDDDWNPNLYSILDCRTACFLSSGGGYDRCLNEVIVDCVEVGGDG